MTTALIIAAFLVLVDFRFGFGSELAVKFIFNFSKTGLYWLDFDLLPTFIGAIILLVSVILLSKRDDRLVTVPARNKSIILLVLSLLTFAQASGRFIAAFNDKSETSMLNPGITADIIYSVTDIICYSLAAIVLANIIDILNYDVSLNENTVRKELMFKASPFGVYYRTFCAFPVFVRIFMTIMIWDNSQILALVTSVIYHALCIFSAVMFALYVKKIRKARNA